MSNFINKRNEMISVLLMLNNCLQKANFVCKTTIIITSMLFYQNVIKKTIQFRRSYSILPPQTKIICR